MQSRVVELQSTRNEKEDRLVALEKELKEKEALAARVTALEEERQENRARLVALEGMVERLTAPEHQQVSFVPAQ